MKAFLFTDNFIILVLSPKIEPPVLFEEGSIAKTATLKPRSIKDIPNVSINVDFPTPGTPVIPTLKEFLCCFNLDNRRSA